MNDLHEQIARPRKVALYSALNIPGFYMVWEVRYSAFDEQFAELPEGQNRELPIEGYVRVSAPIDLKFDAVATNEVVQNAVASLDAAERKAIAELNQKIAAIREQKAQLLALTHQPEIV